MLYLILAIGCGALFYVIIRVSKTRVKHPTTMIACNYVACVGVALVTMLCQGNGLNHPGLSYALTLGGICGFFYVASIVLIDASMVRNGIVLTTLFARLGLLIPLCASIVVFGEVLSTWQGIGILLALGAILLMHAEKGLQSFRLNGSLILLLTVNGMTTALLKVYDVHGESALASLFLCVNFLVASVLAFVLAWHRRESIDVPTALYGSLLGLVNFHTSRFFLMALETIPGSIAYPVQSVSIIVLIALIGLFAFHEHLKTNQWIGFSLCAVVLVLLNLR